MGEVPIGGGGHAQTHYTENLRARHTVLAYGAREELHRNLTPAEAKLWARLRAHQIGGVHFRNHTVLAVGARDTPLANML